MQLRNNCRICKFLVFKHEHRKEALYEQLFVFTQSLTHLPALARMVVTDIFILANNST